MLTPITRPLMAAALAAPLPLVAVEPPRFSGYTTAKGILADGQDIAPETEVDFAAAAQLELDWDLPEGVRARFELRADDEAGIGPDGLEEAYLEWKVHQRLILTAGSFESLIGWEAADEPERHRISEAYAYAGGHFAGNGSPVEPYGIDPTGLLVTVPAGDHWSFHLYAVDEAYGSPNPTRPSDRISGGVTVTLELPEIGVGDLDVAFGNEEAPDGDHIVGIDANVEIDGLHAMHGWLFAAEVNVTDYSDGTAVGGLVMARLDFPTDRPLGLAGHLSTLDPDTDTADDEGSEVALALIANPTDDRRFELIAEGRYISRAGGEDDEWSIGLQGTLRLP